MQNQEWKGIVMERRSLVLFHLLFEDDNVLFLDASDHAVLIRTLQRYGDLSQTVNLQKSVVFFRKAVNITAQQRLSSSLNIQHAVRTDGKYLGLPYVIGCSK